MTSVPSSSVRELVKHKFAEDRHIPYNGEIIVVRLSEDLTGPGSTLPSVTDLPSCATRRNYHHAILLSCSVPVSGLEFIVFPVPAYSATVPISHLTSTEWLLSQPAAFQQTHIPLPFEETTPPEQAQPLFPTPVAFGEPLKVVGWKNTKPSWVQVVPQVVTLKTTTLYTSFNPPVKLSDTELLRLLEYSKRILSPSVSRNIPMSLSPPPPDDEDVMSRTLDPSSSDHNAPSTSRSGSQEPGQSNNCGDGNFAAGGSTALEVLCATEVVRDAFTRLFNRDESDLIFLDSDDGSDDDEDWEDNMDPLTFARYYAGPSNPHFVKMVQDHDRETRARFDHEMKSWAEGVVVESQSPSMCKDQSVFSIPPS